MSVAACNGCGEELIAWRDLTNGLCRNCLDLIKGANPGKETGMANAGWNCKKCKQPLYVEASINSGFCEKCRRGEAPETPKGSSPVCMVCKLSIPGRSVTVVGGVVCQSCYVTLEDELDLSVAELTKHREAEATKAKEAEAAKKDTLTCDKCKKVIDSAYVLTGFQKVCLECDDDETKEFPAVVPETKERQIEVFRNEEA